MRRPVVGETYVPRDICSGIAVRPPSGEDGRRNGFGGGGELREEFRIPSAQLGLWIFLGTVTMLFAGFTSAYLVRQAGPDWQPLPRPAILWINTGVLVTSSIVLEIGRRRRASLRRWVLGAALLGLLFLLGQVQAWRVLRAAGIYLPTHPHSSFFYILTGVHGAHVLGGVIALLVLLARAWSRASDERLSRHLALGATYWHFVGGLWLYLLIVLFLL